MKIGKLTFIFILAIVIGGVFFFVFSSDITTTTNPARDLTGNWDGIVTFTERVPNCVYSADYTMNLAQNGNNVVGGFNVVIREVKSGTVNCLRTGTQLGFPVAGSISSSAINMLISGTDKLKGSFTTDQMTLRWELCDACASGPAIKFTGPMFLTRS